MATWPFGFNLSKWYFIIFIYKLGINGGRVPLATVVGMFKSVVSVVLLFGANKISKAVRGESIM